MARRKQLRPVSCTVYQGADGLWHGYINVGTRADGRPDRRHRTGRTRDGCEQKIRELEDQAAAGPVAEPGRVPTLEAWLGTWLDEIVVDLDYQTRRTYGWAVRTHLIPGLGGWRLDQLQAGHIEGLYRAIAKDPERPEAGGLKSSSVHTVHRALRAALGEAVRRSVLRTGNPMGAVRSPSLDEDEVTPLEVSEVRRIIEVCQRRRNGTRWIVGLSCGLRQGETLGLPWLVPTKSTRDKPLGLDLGQGVIVVRRQAQRRSWEHGCDDPIECAKWAHGCPDQTACLGGDRAAGCPKRRRRCRTGPCPPSWEHGCEDPAGCGAGRRAQVGDNVLLSARGCPRRRQVPCRRHQGKRGCPPPCQRDCTRHASTCPRRHGGGIVMDDPKSAAGRRRVALPDEIVRLLRAHRAAQAAERLHAGTLWEDHGLVWCQETGRPIDSSRDRQEWKQILAEAGVRDARVHDGRHTAATMLLLLGVDHQTVMATMGWSDGRMLKRYQHVVDELLRESARRVGLLLFGGNATDLATESRLRIG